MPSVSTDKKGTKRAMKIEMQYGKNITTHRELMLATGPVFDRFCRDKRHVTHVVKSKI